MIWFWIFYVLFGGYLVIFVWKKLSGETEGTRTVGTAMMGLVLLLISLGVIAMSCSADQDRDSDLYLAAQQTWQTVWKAQLQPTNVDDKQKGQIVKGVFVSFYYSANDHGNFYQYWSDLGHPGFFELNTRDSVSSNTELYKYTVSEIEDQPPGHGFLVFEKLLPIKAIRLPDLEDSEILSRYVFHIPPGTKLDIRR